MAGLIVRIHLPPAGSLQTIGSAGATVALEVRHGVLANAVRLQFHALAYNLGKFMRTLPMPKAAAVVADQPTREADQDRGQGRQPRPLRDLPVGRGGRATADVPGNPVADRPAAGSTRPSMTGSGVEWCGRNGRGAS